MKTYIAESLSKDEKLIYATRPHWVVFIPAIAILLLAALVFLYLPKLMLINQSLWHNFSFHQLISMFLVFLGIVALLRAYLFYTTSEYSITNKRVIMKRGFIQRYSTEVFLSKIEGVKINQSFTGRILNYGNIIIIGTGGTKDYYSSVPNPVRFRKWIQQQL